MFMRHKTGFMDLLGGLLFSFAWGRGSRFWRALLICEEEEANREPILVHRMGGESRPMSWYAEWHIVAFQPGPASQHSVAE